jgi:hypothetical protein
MQTIMKTHLFTEYPNSTCRSYDFTFCQSSPLCTLKRPLMILLVICSSLLFFSSDTHAQTYQTNYGANNASISEFVGPIEFCNGNQDIKVKLKNTGNNLIYFVTIQWTLDGVHQTPVYWNSPLDTAGGSAYANDTTITIGNVLFNYSTRLVRAWTEIPNYIPDTVNYDDTLTVALTPALGGNYTIDANGSGMNNFTSFSAAAAALSAKGICSPVYLTVAPGTYVEQPVFSQIPGASSTNTITIDGVDTATRKLTFAGSSSNYATLTISSVPYLTVKNLTINATTSTGFGILINGASDYTRISKCRINAVSGSFSTDPAGIVVGGSSTSYNTGGRTDNLMIDSNVVNGGYYGIVFYHLAATASVNNNILYNTINNTSLSGISVRFCSGILISGNYVNTSDIGIYCSNTSNSSTRVPVISNNRVINARANPLYVSGSNAAGRKGQIINNMLGGGMRSGSDYLCFINGNYWSFAHNTLHRDFSTTNIRYGGLFIGSASGISVMNNIFSSTKAGSNGLPLYAVNASTLDSMDYNTFYRQDTSNGQLIFIGTSLNSGNFKGFSGFNSNSTYDDPLFASDTNLTVTRACIQGTPLAYVTTDIYGNSRSASPSRGALEYARVNVDALVEAVVSPTESKTSGLQDIVVRIRNQGAATLTSLFVNYTENNGTPKTVHWTGSLAPCDTASVVFSGANQINITSVHNMFFYTSMPNGIQDQNPANDTITDVFIPALAGNYTIGGAGANYPNFIAAAADLSLKGVAAPVNFTVNAGTYTGQVELKAIPGVSASNPITFNGVDAATCIMTHYASASSFPTLIISSVPYVTFRNLTINATHDIYAFGVLINGKSDGTRITNCVININSATAAAIGIIVGGSTTAFSAGLKVDNITLDSNTITGGLYGIACYSRAANYSVGNKVMYNNILNASLHGIYMFNNRAITVSNNFVNKAGNYGIYCINPNNEGAATSKILNNRIINVGGALYVSGSHDTGNKGLITNNMLGGGISSGSYYICYLNGNNWSFTHNTVHRDSITTDNRYGGLYLTQISRGISVTNNIFSSTRAGNLGLPLYALSQAAFDTLDYNIYYREDTSNSQLIYLDSAISVANFKGASGYNQHSQFVNPDFINDTNLVTRNGCTAGLGLSYVTTDINGVARNTTSPTPGATEHVKHPEDIKIEAVTYPNAPFTAGYQDIGVRVRNVGTSTITSFNITYTSNNGLPVTTSWFGSLASCDTVTALFNGPFQLNINGVHSMKFYTSQPNWTTDGDLTNDTLKTIFLLPLNGTYTVGGSSADFATAVDAVHALKLGGVSGPVTFNFTPNMPAFNAGFELDSVSGISDVNTVTFNGNGDTLVGGQGTYVVALNGASYITLNGFYMKAADFAAPGMGIRISNKTHHVTIKNNTINLGTDNTFTATAAIAVTGSTTSPTNGGSNATYLTIDSNTLIGGYYSLTLTGSSSYPDNYGHKVRGNVCRDFYSFGIYLNNADSIQISGNDIHRMNRDSVSDFYGLYLSVCRNIKITGNAIHDAASTTGNFTSYSVYVITSLNAPGYETEFINNTIYNPATTGTVYGIYLLQSCSYMKFYHNTVDLDLPVSNSNSVRGIYMTTAPNNYDFKNNIVSIKGNGTGIKHLIYAAAVSSSIASDYNVLYMGATSGSNYVGYVNGGNRTTLTDWRTASMVDANSRSANPAFSNALVGNLTPLSVAIDNIGTNVGVTTDITGALRSTSTPDAGAFEFNGVSDDILLKSVWLKRSSQCYSTNDTIFAVVENRIGSTVDFSTNPLTFIWNNAGPVNSNGSIVINSGTLNQGVSDTFYATNADMSAPGNYTLSAYIQSNAVNINTGNDTLPSPVMFNVLPILSASTKTAFVNNPTATTVLRVSSPLFPRETFLFTEVCHDRNVNGAPASWPSYLIADDYVEITGAPNSDLGGYTLEQWNSTTLISTYTFPTGTLMSPNGTAIIAVGELGASIPVPASFYYHGNGNYTGYFESGTTPVGRILKNSSGVIVDVVTYNYYNIAYTFPVAANVSATDWSGSMPSGASSSGLRLVGNDLNNPTNWIVSSAANTQDPQTLNANVPALTTLTGFNWYYNGSPISAWPRIEVGPYATPGTYTYIATYTNACGTFYDTAIVTAGAGVPVKLLSFDATAVDADVQLTWKTASEKNAAHFEVYRSTDHKNWTQIGTSKAGGNSNISRNYSLTDRNAMSLNVPAIFYKLKSVDKNGTFEWSRETSINTRIKPGSIAVYPNPFTANLTVRVASEGAARVEITTLQGELLFNQSVNSNNGTFNLNNLNLKAGIYFIRVTQNGTTSVQKLIKE